MADEANPAKAASPRGRADEMGRCCAVGAGASGLGCSTFLLNFFVVWVPLTMELCQEGLSEARKSQDSVLMLKSFRETFRLSLNRFLCPPAVCLP